MLILGVDPGLATVGVGVVEARGGRFRALEYGSIITKPRQLLENRLAQIYDQLTDIIVRHRPDVMAVEELFFNTNQKTEVAVAQARGVILLAAQKQGLDVHYVLCSGDPASLDGVYLPQRHLAWMDGTAPHAAEPRFFSQPRP